MPVTELVGVAFTVADLAGTAAFYARALGLEAGAERSEDDPARIGVLGLEPGVTMRAVDVGIGEQTLTLTAFSPAGQPYPPERASNDQWFQHVALVSEDIRAGRERLTPASPGEITSGGQPVILPPNTGRVGAFKFRDPEGHPLELLSFPKGVGDPVWQGAGGGIAGYDHTAISVMDVDRSLAFYVDLLGFRIGGRSLNHGVEQDRLDGLSGCTVDVVALQPASAPTPHVELLHYRTPAGRTSPSDVRANDVASARQILRVDDLDGLLGRLESAGTALVSPGAVSFKDGTRAAAVRDPDGHLIVLTA